GRAEELGAFGPDDRLEHDGGPVVSVPDGPDADLDLSGAEGPTGATADGDDGRYRFASVHRRRRRPDSLSEFRGLCVPALLAVSDRLLSVYAGAGNDFDCAGHSRGSTAAEELSGVAAWVE